MEKFGIFELLDTLAALTDSDAPAQTPTAEEGSEGKKMPDDAFRAPTYGAPTEQLRSGETQAIDGFLARHDAISRKAKR